MKKIIPLFYCLMSLISHAQNHEIDSVRHLLFSHIDDTTRVNALCELSFRLSDTDTCLKMDNEALILARKIKFLKGEAKCLNQFGNDFLGTSNYPKALEFYLQSLQLNEKLGNLKGVAANYSNISNIYVAQEDYVTALGYLYKSSGLYQQFGSDHIRIVYSSIGGVYEKTNQLDSALVYYNKSLDIFTRISDKYQLSSLLAGLGNVNAKLGHTELAFAYYRMGLYAAAPFKGASFIATNYYGLASLFKQTGQIDSSVYYAKRALAAAKNTSAMVVKSAALLSDLYEGKDDKQYIFYYKLATKTRDSTLTAQKQLQLKNMSFNEKARQLEIVAANLQVKEERNHNLQYAAIIISLITFVILFLVLSRSIIVKTKFIEFFGVLGLLAVFEFINLFIHPYLSHATNDSPILMLVVLIAIGALLIPLHHKLEKWITLIMVQKNKKIRLDAAKKTIQQLEG